MRGVCGIQVASNSRTPPHTAAHDVASEPTTSSAPSTLKDKEDRVHDVRLWPQRSKDPAQHIPQAETQMATGSRKYNANRRVTNVSRARQLYLCLLDATEHGRYKSMRAQISRRDLESSEMKGIL